MPNEQLISLGITVILIGFLLLVVGSFGSAEKSQVKVGVGGFIGPIPFGFANDPRMLWVVLALSVLLFVFMAR
ncbi:MAG: DUF131 domain-containing protein [Candidatus Aenigmarchaeota archaeon]|nr:DUF131 domain-containing protein [Candidatus Aenigmarchaeota archaeon]